MKLRLYLHNSYSVYKSLNKVRNLFHFFFILPLQINQLCAIKESVW